ncbi:hypothetical protein BDV26DRAFT_122250 [Aspergillus bertholletiae]|uniref:Uncharacterized protein n=1 Tax=Aspergillus bertholletiae TaxID=1226010 RepID=A0A5N7AP54_9EURO|nr:hypothetical protein BDV26DRAFT_122250 [Aspergillus bertholletiae]
MAMTDDWDLVKENIYVYFIAIYSPIIAVRNQTSIFTADSPTPLQTCQLQCKKNDGLSGLGTHPTEAGSMPRLTKLCM